MEDPRKKLIDYNSDDDEEEEEEEEEDENEEYGVDDSGTVYAGGEVTRYQIDDGVAPLKTRSMIKEVAESNHNEEQNDAQILEKQLLHKIKSDRSPLENLDYVPVGNVGDDDRRKSIRKFLREDRSVNTCNLIAKKLNADLLQVTAIADEMDEEDRKKEYESSILTQQRMLSIPNPEIPQNSRPIYDPQPPQQPQYEQQFKQHVDSGSSKPPDITNMLLMYLMENAKTANNNFQQMMIANQQAMQAQNTQYLQMMMSGKKNDKGFFDGEIGDFVKAKMLASVLNPGGGSEVSSTALILKSLVDNGQLGGILTEATGLLRDLAGGRDNDEYQTFDVNARDMSSSLPPMYQEQKQQHQFPIPQSPPPLPQSSPQPKPQPKPPQPKHVTLPPNNVDYSKFTPEDPEYWAHRIVKKMPGTDWEIAMRSAGLIIEEVRRTDTPLMSSQNPKDIAFGMIGVIHGVNLISEVAKSVRELLDFDSSGNYNRSPEEAAEFIMQNMPERAEAMAGLKVDTLIETTRLFKDCRAVAKPIAFLNHPDIKPLLKRFINHMNKNNNNEEDEYQTDNDVFDNDW